MGKGGVELCKTSGKCHGALAIQAQSVQNLGGCENAYAEITEYRESQFTG